MGNYRCKKCGNICGINLDLLDDFITVSDCCSSPVKLNGIEYSFWDYNAERLTMISEAKMDMLKEQQFITYMEEAEQ